MGTCKSTQKDIVTYSTKTVANHKNFPELQLILTTEKLIKFQSDCLLIFTDKLERLKKNPYLLKCGKSETRRLQQFAKNYVFGKEIEHQQCLMFKNQIELLKFQYISIVGVNIWNGRVQMHSQFRQVFLKFLTEIKDKNWKSVTILNPCELLGYPANIISRGILKDLYGMQKQISLRKITIILKDQECLKFYLQTVDNVNQDNTQSVFQNKSIKQSAYY